MIPDNNIEKSVLQARREGGVFDVTSQIGILAITGKDRTVFLNNLLTTDLSPLTLGTGKETLLLTPQATILFRLWIFSLQESFLLILPDSDLDSCKKFLENRIFVEQVQIHPLPDPLFYFEKTLPPELLLPEAPPLSAVIQNDLTLLRLDLSGETGYLVVNLSSYPSGEKEVFSLLAYEGLHPHLSEAGFFHKMSVMELPHWERFFDFNKGCYPGQEIITRSRSRNQTPARRVVLLRLTQKSFSPFFQKKQSLINRDLSIGTVISTRYSPYIDTEIAWAQVHRDFSVPGQVFPVQEGKRIAEIEVIDTLFSQPENSHFRKVMESGLTAYHQNNFIEARKQFMEATALSPSHPDPWEALAVIEEKEGNLDEAIRLNKTFAEKNPDSPLAKTNLSRLYMLKGWIEKAEEEKRKATVLMFKAAAREKKLHDHQVKIETPPANNENKKRIFRQVLEMDGEDEIAHFGLGKLLFEEENYMEAEEHFRKTLIKNPSYSLSYSFLAKCRIQAGDIDEAKALLETGITHARKQGQMIPLKAMEDSLRQIN